jgi:hypothetical protein
VVFHSHQTMCCVVFIADKAAIGLGQRTAEGSCWVIFVTCPKALVIPMRLPWAS